MTNQMTFTTPRGTKISLNGGQMILPTFSCMVTAKSVKDGAIVVGTTTVQIQAQDLQMVIDHLMAADAARAERVAADLAAEKFSADMERRMYAKNSNH